jgi:RNA polymerase sigma-70 factor (ECF subfamily)
VRENRQATRAERDALIDILAEKASKGDRDALSTLCEKASKIAIFCALNLVGNLQDAEDIAQESLLSMCEKIGELRETKAFRGWFMKIVASKARDHYRKNLKSMNACNIDDYVDNLREENKDFLPQEFAEDEEVRRTLMEMVDGLPPRQREAVFYYYYEGLRMDEIAEIMNISQPNISNYLTLAREKLKCGLEQEKSGSSYLMKAFSMEALMFGAFDSKLRSLSESDAVVERMVERIVDRCNAQIAAPPKVISKPPASKKRLSPFWPITIVLSITVLVLGFLFARERGVEIEHTPIVSMAQPEIIPFKSKIMFSGGTDRGEYAYLNPTGSSVQDQTGDNPGILIGWTITPLNSDSVLYSGVDISPDAAIRALTEGESPGIYMLYLQLEDSIGVIYTISRNFQCAPE